MRSKMTLAQCKKCRGYTLSETCPKCSIPTSKPHPSRFSPEDRYGVYRRKLKLESMKGDK
ncbi:MAG TPA: RNA-protein complex protein Nop10 [Euryarchaeota archaeon]|nr:RNA-protein complex protein Nop10 [Euryarchaeota archaeon]HDH27814.1 RNA-protein complex protein Nop10 [Euryarchaeota archaeon]HDY74760.1 RNA-protein complex protein Nop10 [Euryarchaeota archaeon]